MTNPIDKSARAQILGIPEKLTKPLPPYKDLLEAVQAYVLWDVCEEKGIGTTELNKNIMLYAKECGKKALGIE